MTPDPDGPSRAELALLTFALLAWTAATAHFFWLGLDFLPTLAVLFARVGVELPPYLRLVHAEPRRVMLSLPFAFLAGSFAGALLLWIAMRRRGLRWRSAAAVQALAVLALVATSATVLASFAVVHVTQAVYQRLATESGFPPR